MLSNIFLIFRKGVISLLFIIIGKTVMDINKNKDKDKDKNKNNSTVKQYLDKLKGKKNIFITKLKILKQLKENGHKTNLETIEKVFNINIKNKKVNNSNNSEHTIDFGIDTNTEIIDNKNQAKKKNVNKSNSFKPKSHSVLSIIFLLIFNIYTPLLTFDIVDNTNFNAMTEQFTEIISRSIKSPQTEIYLKSKFESDNNSIIYYYEIIDNLDSYIYKIKNTEIDNELRIKLLENIALKTKEISNLANIKTTDYNSISLVGDYYIINNKYKINENNLNGKDINLITCNIKNNNINNYNKNRIEFLVSAFITLSIIEGFIFIFIDKYKKTRKIN